MVQAHDDGERIDSAHDSGARAVTDGDEPLGSRKDPVLNDGEDGTDNGEGEIRGHYYGDERSYEEVDHLGYVLMQPFFKRGHKQDCQYYRDDVTLIAYLLDRIEEYRPGGNCFRRADVPCVQKGGVDHHKTDNGAEEDVSSEYAGGGDGDENGQESKCGVRNEIEEGEKIRLSECGSELRDRLNDTHHKAGGHDRGQNRNEDVAGCFEDLLPDRHF